MIQVLMSVLELIAVTTSLEPTFTDVFVGVVNTVLART